MTPTECLTELETRITARFTPSLNTASALEALILVAETIREMKAEVEAGDGATPQAETHDADGRCVECGLLLESCPVCGDSPEPQAEPGDEIARATASHHHGCICAACQPSRAAALAEEVRAIGGELWIDSSRPRADREVEVLEAAARSIDIIAAVRQGQPR